MRHWTLVLWGVGARWSRTRGDQLMVNRSKTATSRAARTRWSSTSHMTTTGMWPSARWTSPFLMTPCPPSPRPQVCGPEQEVDEPGPQWELLRRRCLWSLWWVISSFSIQTKQYCQSQSQYCQSFVKSIIFKNPNLKLRKYHTIQSRRDKMQLPSEDKDIGEQSLHKHFRRPLVS